MDHAERRRGLLRLAFVVGCTWVGTACRPTDDPAARAPRTAERTHAAAPSGDPTAEPAPTPPPPSTDPLPAGPVFEGLVIPAGGRVILEDSSGTLFRVPYDARAVAAHVRGQLVDGTSTAPAPGVTRFARVTPKGADPNVVRLYVLVSPRAAGDATIRVQRLPTDVSPEANARRVEQFQRDLPTLD